MLSIILWTAVIGLIISFFYKRKPPNYPPGPFALPLLGNPQLLFGDLMKNFDKFGARYGNVFSIQLGPFPAVVLNSHDTVRQAFAQEIFSGRPTSDLIDRRNEGKRGIIFNDGRDLQEVRRFVLRSLRDLGLGKMSIEESVKLEISEISKFFRGKDGAPTCLRNKLNLATVNALWRITTGESFDMNDPISQIWFQELTDSTQGSGFLNLLSTEMIRKLYPPAKKQFDTDVRLIKDVKTSFRKIIEKHQNTEPQDDLVSLYLEEAQKVGPDSSLYGEEGITNLVIVLMDLFVAGSETTATTLTWFFLLMALYPDVQKKIQSEIDETLGTRSPSIVDKPQLVYTEAAINETMRYVTLVPMGIFHRAVADVEFNGHFFPKDLLIISNLHAVSYDSNVWEKPDEFLPERFLVNKEKKYEAFMPFSVGKRVCLGESLARMELFLFTTSLLQEFSFALPDGVSHTIELTSTLIRGPKPYQLIITPRK